MARTPAYERPLQLPLFWSLLHEVAAANDGPLTHDELCSLSRAGWERLGERVTPGGILLVQMRNLHSEEREVSEKTPGGWRMELT